MKLKLMALAATVVLILPLVLCLNWGCKEKKKGYTIGTGTGIPIDTNFVTVSSGKILKPGDTLLIQPGTYGSFGGYWSVENALFKCSGIRDSLGFTIKFWIDNKSEMQMDNVRNMKFKHYAIIAYDSITITLDK